MGIVKKLGKLQDIDSDAEQHFNRNFF